MTTRTITTVPSRPDIDSVSTGTIVAIVIDGIYWGCYEACRNWCGERFWLEYFPPYGWRPHDNGTTAHE